MSKKKKRVGLGKVWIFLIVLLFLFVVFFFGLLSWVFFFDPLTSSLEAYCPNELKGMYDDALVNRDVKICDYINGDEQYRLFGVGSQMCRFGRFGEVFSRSRCLTEFAREYQDISYCEMAGLDEFGNCLFVIESIKDSHEACNILEGEYHDICVFVHISQSMDENRCLELDSGWHDDCYYDVAMDTSNAETCKKIDEEYLRDNCILLVKN